ncbi:MAG: response regulator [Syntrophobacteraceae bacterium]|jgi:two-component system chemotaxis response regulator CheY
MKILITEDGPVAAKLMRLMLEPYGECDTAISGREALIAFRLAAKEGRRYDLICLDIMMPGLDGLHVLKEIRKMESADGIPVPDGVKIIMTTAVNDPGKMKEALDSQCTAYLVKPIGKQKLLEQFRALGLLEESS